MKVLKLRLVAGSVDASQGVEAMANLVLHALLEARRAQYQATVATRAIEFVVQASVARDAGLPEPPVPEPVPPVEDDSVGTAVAELLSQLLPGTNWEAGPPSGNESFRGLLD